MIEAKDYFEKYLIWKRKDSNLRSAKETLAPYSAMDLVALRAEAEAENPGAMEELGERYLFGLDELSADKPQAITLLEKAAACGHPDAMHMLAELRRTDEYGMQDYDAYFSLLKKAAESGSWKAMYNLACAYYKGRDAYAGHGFDKDRLSALKWSTNCAVMTMGLLELAFTGNCSNEFKDYLDEVSTLFVQSICISARQLILGDGVPKDLQWAGTMLHDAQQFYTHFFETESTDFAELLAYCEKPE